MPDINREASEFWAAMKPMIDEEIKRQTQGMVQRRKAKVTTAPSLATNTIGVTEPFGSEMFVPFTTNIISATVGDVVWVEFMYGATNAFASMFASVDDKDWSVAGNLNVEGNETVGGSITVGNVLNITNRRSSASSGVSAGWHRVLEFAPTTASYRLGRAGLIIDFDITRFSTSNETHHVSLSLLENNAKFYGEESNSSTQLIDKVRYTYDDAKGYVDIHLSSSWSANVAVDYQVSASAASFFAQIKTMNLADVSDAPTGETVMTEYTLNERGVFISDLLLNGFLNFERITVANSATGAINIQSSSSAYMLMTGVNANCFVLCSARANSSGIIAHGETIIGSGTIGATFSTSTNTLSITNNSGNELQILILRF